MKSLDFAAMENVQGGVAGNINLNLPLTSLLGALGMGSLLGLGLGAGLGISFSLTGLNLPSLGLGFLGL